MIRESNNNYISLQEATEYCSYTQEYLSLRARQGKLKAVKIGRNWITKKEWVKEYIERMKEYNNNFSAKKLATPSFAEASKGKPPENLPVEEKLSVRITSQQAVPKIRFAFSLALIFVLLIAGTVFGKESFKSVFNDLDPYVKEISQAGNRLILDSVQSFENVFEDTSPLVQEFSEGFDRGVTNVFGALDNTFSTIAQKILKPGQELAAISSPDVLKSTLNIFKEYGQWVSQTFKSGYLAFNYFIEEKLDNASRTILNGLKSFAQGIRKIPQSITGLFKKEIGKPEKEKPEEEFVKIGEIEKLKEEIKDLKEKPAKEIIKEVEVSRITKIEPIKEITKEIKTLDEESLKRIRTILSQQETKVEKLKLAARLGYINLPPTLSPSGAVSVTTLGTITAGTWQGGAISTTYGGTGADLSAGPQGGVLYMGGSSITGVSAAGTSGDALISGGTGVPAWTNTPSWSTITLSTSVTSPTIYGSSAASGNLTLRTTSDASKGSYILSELTSNGFVKTSGGTGALSIDETSYQAAGNYITALTGEVTATGPGSAPATITSQTSETWLGKVSDATGTGKWVFGTSPTFTTQITSPIIYGGSAANEDITIEGTSHATKTTSYVILQPTGGNVGIGTTEPSFKLEVAGDIGPDGHITRDLGSPTAAWDDVYVDTLKIDTGGNIYGLESERIGISASFEPDTASGYSLGGTTKEWANLYIGTGRIYLGAGQESSIYASTNDLILSPTGNVGIGTTSPSSLLDITKTAIGVTQLDAYGLSLVNTTAAALDAQQYSPPLRWRGFGWETTGDTSQSVDFRAFVRPIQGTTTTGGLDFQSSINGAAYGNLFTILSGGNVGIGTTSPGAKLEIAGASSNISNTSGDITINSASGNISLSGGSLTNINQINSDLGIHRASPSVALEIEGALCVDDATDSCSTGNAGTIYAEQTSISEIDLAENYPSRQTLKGGEVVAVDPADKEHILRTTQKYQPDLIGVISTKPGILLGGFNQESSKNAPVALAGRVPVEVCLENGPIEIGDYLTSSSQPGVAMRATEPGRVIGIALESYDSEEIVDKAMVFVNPNWYGGSLDPEGELPVPYGAGSTEEIGTGPIFETFIQKVKQTLASLGLFIENGIVKIKQLFAEKVRTEKLEMVDQTTGEIWCTWIENGEWQKVKGECESLTSTSSEQPPSEEPPDEEPLSEEPPDEEPPPIEQPSVEQPSTEPETEPTPEPTPEPTSEPAPTPIESSTAESSTPVPETTTPSSE